MLFVTNNSAATVERQEDALAAIGIPAHGDVLTSSMAAGLLIQPGERVLVCGGPGVVQAVEQRGANAVLNSGLDDTAGPFDAGAIVPGTSDPGLFDAVVVGIHPDFDYAGLRRAATAVRRGARLIGTNDDATFPTPHGPIPGGGAILAAVTVASGAAPTIAGKPHEPMAALVRAVVGADRAAGATMIGDRPDTDGRFARTLGCRFALVWSGVTEPGAVADPSPDLAAADLAAIASSLLASSR